jgi:hypothetical protein
MYSASEQNGSGVQEFAWFERRGGSISSESGGVSETRPKSADPF